MENVAQAIRQGEGAASGAAAIIVEKHKNNFMAQHGTFEDKPAQNITRWLEKADTYKRSHMIHSLEMASILIHCIKGEPAVKVRRMLDVPGINYIHADHYCEQPLQPAVVDLSVKKPNGKKPQWKKSMGIKTTIYSKTA